MQFPSANFFFCISLRSLGHVSNETLLYLRENPVVLPPEKEKEWQCRRPRSWKETGRNRRPKKHDKGTKRPQERRLRKRAKRNGTQTEPRRSEAEMHCPWGDQGSIRCRVRGTTIWKYIRSNLQDKANRRINQCGRQAARVFACAGSMFESPLRPQAFEVTRFPARDKARTRPFLFRRLGLSTGLATDRKTSRLPCHRFPRRMRTDGCSVLR